VGAAIPQPPAGAFCNLKKEKNWQIAVVERAILVRFSKLSQFT
jgi:hypothetical protein